MDWIGCLSVGASSNYIQNNYEVLDEVHYHPPKLKYWLAPPPPPPPPFAKSRRMGYPDAVQLRMDESESTSYSCVRREQLQSLGTPRPFLG